MNVCLNCPSKTMALARKRGSINDKQESSEFLEKVLAASYGRPFCDRSTEKQSQAELAKVEAHTPTESSSELELFPTPGASAEADIPAKTEPGDDGSGHISVASIEIRQNVPSQRHRRSLRYSQKGVLVEATLVEPQEDTDNSTRQTSLREGSTSQRHDSVESDGIIVNATRVSSIRKSVEEPGPVRSFAFISLILLVIIGITVVAVALTRNSSETTSATTPKIELWVDLLPKTTMAKIDTSEATPQAQAYDWVESASLFSNYSVHRKVQLFTLATLYFALDGDNWSNTDDWLLPEVEECDWFSTEVVACNVQREYFTLSLSQNALSGTVPEELFLLTSLATLDLSQNNISGLAGYDKYENLPDLYKVDLSHNGLSGPVAKYMQLFDLPALAAINLRSNRITGNIPVFEIPGTFVAWEDIDFSNNLITGQVPEMFGEFRRVDVSNNRLTGSLPSRGVGGAKPMEIKASNNMVSGTLPKSMGELNQLQVFDLSHNLLTGAIPKEFANWAKIRDLNLASNQFNGDISVVSNWEKIERLDLSNNTFTGPLPYTLGRLADVKSFLLNDNKLMGTIHVTIGNMTAARVIHLSGNLLSGSLPTELGELSNLEELDVHGNLLTGTIPSALGRLTSLSMLSLYGNALWGSVPEEVCDMKASGSLKRLTVNCTAVDCSCSCSCG